MAINWNNIFYCKETPPSEVSIVACHGSPEKAYLVNGPGASLTAFSDCRSCRWNVPMMDSRRRPVVAVVVVAPASICCLPVSGSIVTSTSFARDFPGSSDRIRIEAGVFGSAGSSFVQAMSALSPSTNCWPSAVRVSSKSFVIFVLGSRMATVPWDRVRYPCEVPRWTCGK